MRSRAAAQHPALGARRGPRATRSGIAPGRLAAAHTEAIAWADEATRELLDHDDSELETA
jgi:hypothetical protein